MRSIILSGSSIFGNNSHLMQLLIGFILAVVVAYLAYHAKSSRSERSFCSDPCRHGRFRFGRFTVGNIAFDLLSHLIGVELIIQETKTGIG